MRENEDDDPVGALPSLDSQAAFRIIAERVGLVQPGAAMDQKLLTFAYEVVDLCATVGDAYGDFEGSGNSTEAIRAMLYDQA